MELALVRDENVIKITGTTTQYNKGQRGDMISTLKGLYYTCENEDISSCLSPKLWIRPIRKVIIRNCGGGDVCFAHNWKRIPPGYFRSGVWIIWKRLRNSKWRQICTFILPPTHWSRRDLAVSEHVHSPQALPNTPLDGGRLSVGGSSERN